MVMRDKPPQQSPLISAQNICLWRGDKPLLSSINLTIARGETTIIMGQNGAGKTMLLSALHGIVPIQSGTITHAPALSQKPDLSQKPALSQKMVFQKPILLRRTAAAHFSFASMIHDEATIRTWFEKAGMADKMTTKARHLSSGEAQKLALIAALAAKPDCLFLDEPTANLDLESRADVEALLQEAKAQGTTLVMVTHAHAQAKRLADTIIYMQQGVIYDHAPAAAFLDGERSPEASAFLSEL